MEQPMSAIRIRKHLDSDTLHLPELRNMIGHDVEITVRDETASEISPADLANEFWNPPSLEGLARRQGFRGPLAGNEAFGSLAEADWAGFDQWLDEQRHAK
jgi:hypothetical protein